MHYVTTEHKLHESHIAIKADYALDGQFVSNWKDLVANRMRFLKPNVEFFAKHFNYSFIITQYVISNFVTFLLFIIGYNYFKSHYKSKFEETKKDYLSSTAFSLHTSLVICVTLSGIAMFVAELSVYVNNVNHVIVQQRMLNVLFFLGIHAVSLCIIILSTICSKKCCRNKESICTNILVCIAFTLLWLIHYFLVFSISWVLGCLLPTLLLSLAYPLYAIILYTLNVTCFIITIIIFAVFVPKLFSCLQKFKNKLLGLITIFICLIVLTVVTAGIYVAVMSIYGSTISERIFPENGLIEVLLLLPSFVVFTGAWLLHKNIFSKYC